MHPVSEDFLQAVQENTRKYYWTGKITTKNGVVYDFGVEDEVGWPCQMMNEAKSKS